MRLWEILKSSTKKRSSLPGNALPEFSQVVLSKPYNHNGLSIPAGVTGVITDVLPHLNAYTVEFESPYGVETVAMWMVKPTKCTLQTPDGTNPCIRTVWTVLIGQNPTFQTLIPKA